MGSGVVGSGADSAGVSGSWVGGMEAAWLPLPFLRRRLRLGASGLVGDPPVDGGSGSGHSLETRAGSGVGRSSLGSGSGLAIFFGRGVEMRLARGGFSGELGDGSVMEEVSKRVSESKVQHKSWDGAEGGGLFAAQVIGGGHEFAAIGLDGGEKERLVAAADDQLVMVREHLARCEWGIDDGGWGEDFEAFAVIGGGEGAGPWGVGADAAFDGVSGLSPIDAAIFAFKFGDVGGK